MTTATEETRGTAKLLENFASKAIEARSVLLTFTAVPREDTEGEEWPVCCRRRMPDNLFNTDVLSHWRMKLS